jgi:hypothetical protein
MRLVVLAILLTSCSKTESLPADCSTVGKGVKQYWAEIASRTTDVEEQLAAAEQARVSEERLVRHCKADHWNDEMIQCTRAVFRLDDSGCMKFLSAMQKQKLALDEDAPPIKGGMGIAP